MWAQLIKSRIRPGKEDEVRNIPHEREGHESSAMRHIFACHSTRDPMEHYTFIMFESEEAARKEEQTPEAQAWAQRMGQIFENPEFVDLEVDFHR